MDTYGNENVTLENRPHQERLVCDGNDALRTTAVVTRNTERSLSPVKQRHSKCEHAASSLLGNKLIRELDSNCEMPAVQKSENVPSSRDLTKWTKFARLCVGGSQNDSGMNSIVNDTVKLIEEHDELLSRSLHRISFDLEQQLISRYAPSIIDLSNEGNDHASGSNATLDKEHENNFQMKDGDSLMSDNDDECEHIQSNAMEVDEEGEQQSTVCAAGDSHNPVTPQALSPKVRHRSSFGTPTRLQLSPQRCSMFEASQMSRLEVFGSPQKPSATTSSHEQSQVFSFGSPQQPSDNTLFGSPLKTCNSFPYAKPVSLFGCKPNEQSITFQNPVKMTHELKGVSTETTNIKEENHSHRQSKERPCSFMFTPTWSTNASQDKTNSKGPWTNVYNHNNHERFNFHSDSFTQSRPIATADSSHAMDTTETNQVAFGGAWGRGSSLPERRGILSRSRELKMSPKSQRSVETVTSKSVIRPSTADATFQLSPITQRPRSDSEPSFRDASHRIQDDALSFAYKAKFNETHRADKKGRSDKLLPNSNETDGDKELPKSVTGSYAHVRRVLSEHLLKIQSENAGKNGQNDPQSSLQSTHSSGEKQHVDSSHPRNKTGDVATIDVVEQQIEMKSEVDDNKVETNTDKQHESGAGDKGRRGRRKFNGDQTETDASSPSLPKRCKSINQIQAVASQSSRRRRRSKKKKSFGQNQWAQARTTITGKDSFVCTPNLVVTSHASYRASSVRSAPKPQQRKKLSPLENKRIGNHETVHENNPERSAKRDVVSATKLPAGEDTGPPSQSTKKNGNNVLECCDQTGEVQRTEETRSGTLAVEEKVVNSELDTVACASNEIGIVQTTAESASSATSTTPDRSVQELKKELESTREMNAKIMQDMMNMQKALQVMEQRFECSGNHEKTIDALETKVSLLTARIQSVVSRSSQSSSESEELRKDVESLQSTLDQLQSERDEAQLRASKLEKDNEGKSSLLEALQKQAELMGHQVTGAENQAFRLQNKLQVEQTRRRQFESAAAVIKQQVIQASSAADSWNVTISQRVSELDKKLTDVERKKHKLATVLARVREERIKASEESTCVICFESKVEVVLVPCGHYSLCMSCSRKLDRCPECRVLIQLRLKTYGP